VAISTAVLVRSLVRSVITPPFSRLILIRRSGIGSRESALAGEHDLVIGDDLEAIAQTPVHISAI
jgi:hypothetical protein